MQGEHRRLLHQKGEAPFVDGDDLTRPVGARGGGASSRSINAISPKISPGPSVSITRSSTTMSTCPSFTSYMRSFDSPGVSIAGFEILIDHLEGQLDFTTAQPLVAGFFPPQDFGHALFVVRASPTGIPPSTLLRTRYNPCVDAPNATNGDFECQVPLAVDAATNPVDGVTCTMTLE